MLKQHFYNQTITCLLGDPVEHSVSDVMFQHFAKVTGVENYNHLKFRISKKNPENLRIAIKALSIFGITGANVTLPYKEEIIQYLHMMDKTSKRIGAVNTVVNKNGKLIGYNTDGIGAIKAIKKQLRPIKKSDRIVIFGAGGAARAIIGSIFHKVSQITILNRNSDLSRARKLKNDFRKYRINIEIKSLTDENIINAVREADFVINATPIGMYPKSHTSLIRKFHLDKINRHSPIKDKGFFDAIFNPFETEFLKLAKEYGAKVCPGIYMMIYQGIEAFKLWTGRIMPQKEIKNTIKALRHRI